MLSTFLSKVKLKGLKVGGPLLSIFETAAQQNLRATQETFTLLASSSLENAEGIAIDRHLADEDSQRIGATPSSGYVTIGDSRYTKVATAIFGGTPAPIVGSSIVYLSSKTGFPTSGYVYLGRGTTNYEGPLQYTSISGSTAPYALNLAVGNYTKKFHNTNESVILAQGGDRVISAGTQPRTPQGNASDAIVFSTVYPATIPDGEVSVEKVLVVATRAGTIGRVVAGAITDFASVPFTGATVTNPLPFTNGNDAEGHRDAKDRVRALRQSRSKATDLALKTAVTGIVAADENKQVQSANILTRSGSPTTIYIDDGSGYEETYVGVGVESFTDYATGGEYDFSISNPRPVTKACVKSQLQAPYNLTAGTILSVYVGGSPSVHIFTSEQVANLSNASAYDVVAAINANPALLFSARTADGGSSVVLFSRNDVNEGVKVAASLASDANVVFAFPIAEVQTMRLYKNDLLLNKDGAKAVVASNSQSLWKAMDGSGTGESLVIDVDGTGAATYYFKDVDFVNAKTGYTKLAANNSLASWVAVFNAKVPGITATYNQSQLILTSNAGTASRASVNVGGTSTLRVKGMFDATLVPVTGATNDYTLNKSTGQIHLTAPLVAGDRLSAGTLYTRAFVETSAITAPVNIATAGKFYLFVDAGAKVVPTNISGSSTLALAVAGAIGTLTVVNGTFNNVLAGDWLILNDTAFTSRGAYRINKVDTTNFAYVTFETDVAVAQPTITLANAGVTVVRANGSVQEINIPVNASYTAPSLVAQINTQIVGAFAAVSRTNRVRVTTNTYGSDGDIMIATVDSTITGIGLPSSALYVSNVSQLGCVEASGSDYGTPSFTILKVNASSTSASFNATAGSITGFKYDMGSSLIGLRHLPYSGVSPGYGTIKGSVSVISAFANPLFTTRKAPLREWLANDRFYAASKMNVGPNDSLNVVVDGDSTSKTFSPNLYRRCSTSGTYGSTITLTDKDNANASLAASFGLSFNFNDFAVYMKPRVQTHGADNTMTALWRYNRFGDVGPNATVRYNYPTTPNATVKVTCDPYSTQDQDIQILLGSGAKTSLAGLSATTRIGTFVKNNGGAVPSTYFFCTGFQIAKLDRAVGSNVVTATILFPDASMSIANPLNIAVGSYVWVAPGAYGTFASTSGYRQVLSVSSGAAPYTFTFLDGVTGSDTQGDGTTSNVGTVYYDTGAANWAGVAVNDIIAFTSASNIAASAVNKGMRVTAVGSTNLHIACVAESLTATSATFDWGTGPVVDPVNNINDFKLTANTIAQVVAAVNDSTVNPNSPITGIVTASVGGGIPSLASWDQYTSTAFRHYFKDGLNFVKTTTNPANVATNYQFVLKNTVDTNLGSGANDWTNEEVRLVPINATSIAAFLNSSAAGGLFANAGITVSSQNSKVQIATATIGSAGSVSVQGGSANTAMASVLGSAGVTGDAKSAYVFVTASEAVGINGGGYVQIDNTLSQNKQSLINNANVNLAGITPGAGKATLVFSQTIRVHHTCKAYTWQIEKQGSYMALVWDGFSAGQESIDPNGAFSGSATPNFATSAAPPAWAGTGSFVAGDFVTVAPTSGSSNLGTFQIVAIDNTNKIVWVYNPQGVEEITVADLDFNTSNSVMVGDNLIIGSDTWGAANRGTYTVTAVGDSQFDIDGTSLQVVAGPITASALNQVISGVSSSLVKQVRAVVQNVTDPSQLILVFEDAANYTLISSNFGSVVKALDKLAFPLGTFTGTDGYAHSVGLVGEATRVLYGDPRDPSTYPGYVSSGTTVTVSGPIIRRIQVSLAIRLRGGIPATAIFDSVRSLVASVVNNSKIGQSIPLSDIVNAAGSVNGVLSVSIVSPFYGPGNDVIALQPYEKPMVLNVNNDIQVSQVGN